MSDTAIGFWIQSADYSAVDHDPVGYETAVQAVRGHDWAQEVARFTSMETSGEDCCPPGVGFTRQVGGGTEFFHACPNAHGVWSVYYQHPDRGTDASLGADGVTLAAMVTLLGVFFRGARADVELAMEPFAA